jgi:hypothetical protein
MELGSFSYSILNCTQGMLSMGVLQWLSKHLFARRKLFVGFKLLVKEVYLNSFYFLRDYCVEIR